MPAWHEEFRVTDDLPVLVLFDGWASLFRDRVVPWRIAMAEKTRVQFECEALPRFIEAQRWYSGKGAVVARAHLADHALWEPRGAEHRTAGPAATWLVQLLELEGPADTPWYFVPLALAWEERDEDRLRGLTAAAVARVRQQANVGLMGDAWSDEAFCRSLAQAMGTEAEIATAHGRLRFRPTAAYARLAGSGLEAIAVSRQKAQSSNTLVSLGERLFLKGYRRLRPGINPEVEMGLFLTEVAGYPNVAPIAGALEYVNSAGDMMSLATLQAYIPNQGDAWVYTQNYLERYAEMASAQQGAAPAAPPALADAPHAAYLALMRILGQRTAELHRALAKTTGNPAFDPQPLVAPDLAAQRERVVAEAHRTLDLLQSARPMLPDAAQDDAARLLEAREALLARIAAFADEAVPCGLRTRIHGDFHLGQVLMTTDDFILIDFEGEPGRSLEERRARQSPLRDVAGMLRSFSYAAGGVLQRYAAEPARVSAMVDPLARWEAQVREAFLEGYSAAAGDAGSVAAETLRAGHGLLGLMELEKALYELAYELKSRPDWVRIPLAGVLRFIAPRGGGHHPDLGDMDSDEPDAAWNPNPPAPRAP